MFYSESVQSYRVFERIMQRMCRQPFPRLASYCFGAFASFLGTCVSESYVRYVCIDGGIFMYMFIFFSKLLPSKS